MRNHKKNLPAAEAGRRKLSGSGFATSAKSQDSPVPDALRLNARSNFLQRLWRLFEFVMAKPF